MKNFLFYAILLFATYNSIYAQNASHGGKPPWTNGNMPKINTQGIYKVINVEATTLEMVKEQAKEELIRNLLIEQGVTVNSVSEYTNDYKAKTSQEDQSSVSYHNQTSIKTDEYKAVIAKVDQYYKYTNGAYNFWALYLVSENSNKPINNLPTIAYKLDRGAWRSLIVPGWGQFYQKRYITGAILLTGEAALLSTAFYFNSKYNSNNIHAQEAGPATIKQEYRDRANRYRTFSYVSLGAAAGWYIYNLVDAFTSKKGNLQYDYRKMNLAVYPTLAPYNTYNMCMMATVTIRL